MRNKSLGNFQNFRTRCCRGRRSHGIGKNYELM